MGKEAQDHDDDLIDDEAEGEGDLQLSQEEEDPDMLLAGGDAAVMMGGDAGMGDSDDDDQVGGGQIGKGWADAGQDCDEDEDA